MWHNQDPPRAPPLCARALGREGPLGCDQCAHADRRGMDTLPPRAHGRRPDLGVCVNWNGFPNSCICSTVWATTCILRPLEWRAGPTPMSFVRASPALEISETSTKIVDISRGAHVAGLPPTELVADTHSTADVASASLVCHARESTGIASTSIVVSRPRVWALEGLRRPLGRFTPPKHPRVDVRGPAPL